ncbi:MAG TPA: tetratricopeptide repeat protein, partial [bacterium]|nr:tetratricopeptide repeat protein [bacterium]
MIGPQEAAAGLSTAQGESAGWWEAVVAFCLRPGMLESLLALAVFGVVAFVWWRLAALQRDAMRREALEDYLLGVEQALQGDLKGAEKRLSAVLEQDPENHYARLLLGKVLADLGHAERAHQQHLYLKKAFAVDSGDNELMLAHSLLGAGMAAEAADVAERALQRMPDRVDGWRFVYRARLQGGEHEAAAVAGRRLLALLRDGPERRRLRQDLARTVASVATLRWHDGDRRAARQLLREVEALAEQSPQLPLLRARLQAGERGVAEVARSLST